MRFRLWALASMALAGTGIADAVAAPPTAAPPGKAVEPAIELHQDGDMFAYTYDLTPVFDEALWKVLGDNNFSEILIQVNLVDSREQLRVAQHHQLQVELLPGGRVRLTSGPKQETTYPNRTAMLKALRAVRGKPIPAAEFAGEQGYLDMLVLVNPVKVFDFPADGGEGVAVGERTVYDRKLEARSAPVLP